MHVPLTMAEKGWEDVTADCHANNGELFDYPSNRWVAYLTTHAPYYRLRKITLTDGAEDCYAFVVERLGMD